MNLLIHELIEEERQKERLAKAAHWRLLKLAKEHNSRLDSEVRQYGFWKLLELGRKYLVELLQKKSAINGSLQYFKRAIFSKNHQ